MMAVQTKTSPSTPTHPSLWHLKMERRKRDVAARIMILEREEEEEEDDQMYGHIPSNLTLTVFLLALFLFSLLVVAVLLAIVSGSDGGGDGGPDRGESEEWPPREPRGVDRKGDRPSLPDMFHISQWGRDGQSVVIDTAKLSPEHREEYMHGYKHFSFNKFLSDRISIRRSLPDTRPSSCRDHHPSNQPVLQASVIVVFHNEPWTLLLRTVYSIIDRSPAASLKEIILVDDGSTVDWLQSPGLERYLSVLNKVQVLRLSPQMGLTKARMRGVEAMTGDVAVFLHASCECTEGWLSPLLSRIQADNVTLAVPVVDRIDTDTLEYIAEPMTMATVGSFTWDLRIIKRLVKDIPKSSDERIPCPVIPDGIFAAHSKTFLDQGGYDDTLTGADVGHIDLSMKTWMCSGKIELVMCSHVGYLKPRARSLTDDELDSSYSTDRVLVSEKWMGDYKKFVLERLPTIPLESEPTGQSLLYDIPKCHNFHWFLHNVEPAVLMDGVILKRGKLTHVAFNETVLIVAVRDAEVRLLDWYVRPTTIWYLMESGQLKTVDNVCLVAKLNKSHGRSKKLTLRSSPEQDTGFVQKSPELLKSSTILFKPAAIPQVSNTSAGPVEVDIIPDELSHGQRLQAYFKDLQPMKDTETSNENFENFPVLDNRLQMDYDYHLNKVNKNFDFSRSLHSASQSKGKIITQMSNPHQVSSPQGKKKVDINVEVKSLPFKKRLKNVAGVKLYSCDSKLGKWSQWTFTKTGALRHVKYNLCLSVHKGGYYEPQLQECDEVDPRQTWHFSGVNLTV